MCRFYGWSFDETWNMPARRFFAMMKAKRKIECVLAIDRIDEALISSDNVNMKWFEGLRSKWTESLNSLLPEAEPLPEADPLTDEQIKSTQVTVLELFRQRKQLMSYG